MSEGRYSTIPDDLGGVFDHIQVEAAMRSKLPWLEDKVRKFLEKKPTYDEINKFLVATQDEILGVNMAQLFAGFDSRVFPPAPTTGGRGNTPLVRLPFPDNIGKK